MLKIKIFIPNKTKEAWLSQELALYEERLRKSCALEWICTKDFTKSLAKVSPLFALDPQGRTRTSEEFSSWLFSKFSLDQTLHFVMGDACGLPSEIRTRCELLSLSPLTFTHQMCRLIFVEQIYRAFEIAKKSPYHK